MIKCPKCNKELEEEAKFCNSCGASVETENTEIAEETVDQEVNVQTEDEVVSEEKTEPEKVTPINEEEGIPVSIPEDETKKKGKKGVISLGGIAAAVLVVVLLLTTIFAGAGQNSYAIYIKDKELFYTQAGKWKPWQITEELVESDDIENEDLAMVGRYLGMYVVLSEDGKRIFYVDKIDSDELSIYYRKVNSKKEPKKIASEVESFEVNAKGNVVTYLSADDGDLYQHNLKEKDKIASEVENFVVSDDGKNIVYQNEEGDIYTKKAGKDKKKLVSEADSIAHVSEDFGTVYYKKNDNLYKKQQGKDAVKIGSDVQSVINVYESGEVYYLKAQSEEIKLSAYVDDDMKKADEAMVKPTKPEYPDYDDYDSFDAWEAAYDQYDIEYDKYYDALDEYYDKEDRDELREELEEETMDTVTYELCYYNGKKEVVLSESATDYETFAEERAAVVYTSLVKGETKKVKLSEIDSIYDVEDMIEDAIKSSGEYYLAVEDKASKIGKDEASQFDMDAAGETIYMIAGDSEDSDEGELYKIKISGKKAGKSKKVDDDVYFYGASFINDSYVYYKDVNDDEEADLYINEKKVDSDVQFGSVSCENGTYAYMTEWDEDDECGTLKKYNGKKAKVLSEEVYDYELLPNGEVLYLYDYNIEKYRGDLYVCEGNKPKKIDEDVVTIIPVYQ